MVSKLPTYCQLDKALEPFATVVKAFQSEVEWLDELVNGEESKASPTVRVAVRKGTESDQCLPFRPMVYRSVQAILSFTAILDPSCNNEVSSAFGNENFGFIRI